MSNGNSKDEVNTHDLYGDDATLSVQDFMKKHQINENRFIYRTSRATIAQPWLK